MAGPNRKRPIVLGPKGKFLEKIKPQKPKPGPVPALGSLFPKVPKRPIKPADQRRKKT